jgi:DNA-binding transcriptional ArsR family regulator
MATAFKGTRRLIDSETGEIIEAQTIVKTAGDAGFHKIWLHHILDAVDEVGNAKMRVLMWLLSKANAQNQIMATKDEIAAATKVSRATVTRLLSALKAAEIVVETRRSVWRLNPDVVFKGDHNKRMAVLIKYQDESQGDLFEQPPVEPEAAGAPLRSVA